MFRFLRRFSTNSVPEYIRNYSEGERLIHDKLAAVFNPSKLRVLDMSGGCGSMYGVEISSKQFNGLSTLKQHRLVNEVLKEEIKQMHGLQLVTSPEK